MNQHDLIHALVRIWHAGDERTPKRIVGTGVLVSPQHVLTCAHVVTEALGLDNATNSADAPRQRVLLDFPASAPEHWRMGSVVLWHPRTPQPSGRYDIAGLELAHVPEGAKPVTLSTLEDTWNQPCRVFGFPAGRRDGNYAEGVLKDVLANGWVLIRAGADAREFVRPGYSGGPVYTPRGVVGMLTEGDREQRVREAVMIPTPVLLAAWPELYQLNSTCPYQGLASFSEANARFFKGRTEVTRTLQGAVWGPPGLTVLTGASGSGKSSLVFAGLVPSLHKGPDPWLVAAFSPGATPFEALARTLVERWQHKLTGSAQLAEVKQLSQQLRSGALLLRDVLVDMLRTHAAPTRLLLVIDQAEALYTQGFSENEATLRPQQLIEQLVDCLSDNHLKDRLSVLVVVRTDFLDRVLEHPRVAQLQQRFALTHYLGAIDNLREVIEEPLRELGLGRLEQGLSERIIQDLNGEPSALPLLAFTLRELWHRQHAGRLTHAAYDEIGGVGRALAHYADAVFEALPLALQRQAQDIFIQLAQPGDTLQVTRRVAHLADFDEDKRKLIKLLADKHLIVTGRSPENADTAEVIHEALFEHWPRLRQWIHEAWDFRRWQETLRTHLRDWLQHARQDDYLLHRARLATAEKYLHHVGDKLSQQERTYIEASITYRAALNHREHERLAREAQLQRRVNHVLSLFLIAALILAGAAGWNWQQARRASADAERQAQQATIANAQLEALTGELELALERASAALASQLATQGLAQSQAPDGNPALGALLAAQAVKLHDDATTRDYLLRTVQHQPHFRAQLDTPHTSLALSPDGAVLVLGNAQGELILVDANRGTVIAEPLAAHHREVTSLAFSADGTILASGGADRTIQLWDASRWERWGDPLVAHEVQVWHLAFSPDGQMLLSAGADDSVIVWNTETLEPIITLPRREEDASRTTLERDRPQQGQGIPVVLRSPAQPGDPKDARAQRSWTASLSFSPDANVLAVAGNAGEIALWDTRTWDKQGALQHPQTSVRGLAFSPDGSWLAAGSENGQLTLWQVGSDLSYAFTFQAHSEAIRNVSYSPDGALLFTTSENGSARAWDARTGQALTETLGTHTSPLQRLASGPNTLVTGSAEGSVVIWNTAPQSPLGRALTAHTHKIEAIAFKPGSNTFVTGSTDGLKLWELNSSHPLIEIPDAHPGGVLAAAFSPDGSVLASSGMDGRLVLRDSDSLEPIGAPLWQHTRPIRNLAFDPTDGALLVGAGVHPSSGG